MDLIVFLLISGTEFIRKDMHGKIEPAGVSSQTKSPVGTS